MLRKTCPKCKKNRNLDKFGVDTNTSDGLRCYCKDCRQIDQKKHYSKFRTKILARTNRYKRTHRKYYTDYAKAYRKLNREVLRVADQKYYRNNKAQILLRTKRWAQENRRKRALIDHRRRARVLKQLGNVSDNIENTLWKKQKGKCFYCRKVLAKAGYHQEHRVPLARGGLHDDRNLCLSCPTCNFKKGYKTDKEFISLRGASSLNYRKLKR